MRVCRKVVSLFYKYQYSHRTGDLLNYYTLSIRNQKCREAVSKHRSERMDRIFWLLVAASTLNFIAAMIAVFLLKSNPLRFIAASFIELLIIFLAVSRRFGRIDLYYLILIPYLLIAAIPTVLVYKGWLP